ncbi:MAG: carbohydrate ABC transporter permease [Anaerolineae bacterium]
MKFDRLPRYLFIAVLSAACLFPLIWMLSYSLRPVGLAPPNEFQLFAPPLAFDNFARVAELIPLNRFALNSLIVVVCAVPLTLLTASWAGFAMTQVSRRTQTALVALCIALMLVPTPTLWVPRFIVFVQFGWIDSLIALIAPALMGTSSFYVLIFYLTFARTSSEIFESARLDGATLWRTWYAIALPLARPAVIAVALLAFTYYWGNYSDSLLYLRSQVNYTLPIGLQMLKQMQVSDFPLLMAAAVMVTAPVVLLFAFAQRFFFQAQVELARWLR